MEASAFTAIFISVGTSLLHEHDVQAYERDMSIVTKDKSFVEWQQRSTRAKPMNHEVINPIV